MLKMVDEVVDTMVDTLLSKFTIFENTILREAEKFGLILTSTRQTQSKRSVASAERLRSLQYEESR